MALDDVLQRLSSTKLEDILNTSRLGSRNGSAVAHVWYFLSTGGGGENGKAPTTKSTTLVKLPPAYPALADPILLSDPPTLGFFSSSYLPCGSNRDQEGGLLQFESCIAQRGDENCQLCFGIAVCEIFVSHPSLEGLLFIIVVATCGLLKKSKLLP